MGTGFFFPDIIGERGHVVVSDLSVDLILPVNRKVLDCSKVFTGMRSSVTSDLN